MILINGNHKPYEIGFPLVVIDGEFNDVALAHIKENTGLDFTPNYRGYEAQVTDGSQIVALLMTYNFKSRYYNNSDLKNTLLLRSDHHTGFDVKSICLDCCKANHIHTGDMSIGDRLSC